MRTYTELTSDEKNSLDILFLDYKKLADRVGMVNSDGNFYYNEAYIPQEPDMEQKIFEKMRLLREQMDRIRN